MVKNKNSLHGSYDDDTFFQVSLSAQEKKKEEENNSYCGLPAVNKMALTERKGANSGSGKEHLQYHMRSHEYVTIIMTKTMLQLSQVFLLFFSV